MLKEHVVWSSESNARFEWRKTGKVGKTEEFVIEIRLFRVKYYVT